MEGAAVLGGYMQGADPELDRLLDSLPEGAEASPQQDEEIRSRLLGVFAGEGGLARVQRLVLTNPTFRMYQRNLAAGLREGACQLVSLPNSKIPESTRSCLCTGSDDVFLHCELQLEKLLTAPTAAPDSTRRHRRHLATTSGPAASNNNFSMTIGGRNKGSSAIDSPLAKLARKMLQTVSGSPPPPSDDDDGGIQGVCEGGNPIESLKQLTSFFAFDWDSPPPETACCGIEQCFPVTKPPVLDLCLSAEVCVPPAIAFGELAGVALCPDGIPDDIEEGLASGLCTMLEDKTRQAIVAQAKEFEITLAAKLCIGGYILDKLPGWFLKALDWLGIDFCFAGAQLRYQPMTGFFRAEIWAKFGGSVLGLKVTLAIEAQLSDTTKNKYDLCSSATCSEEEFCRMCAGEERGTIELKVSYLVLRSKSWEWSIGDGDRDGCCGGGALSEGDREEVMDALRETNSSTILLSQQGDETWEPSKLYKWNDFLAALDTVSTTGIGEELFWLGDDSANGLEYGLVNVAAFLAQSMKETIMFDACDENSWDRDSDPKYSAANACGQLGQSYQDYKCKAEEAHMACAVDPDMEIRGKTHATWWGAPPPLFCAPRSKVPKAPKWNYLTPNCDPEVERDTDLSLQEYLQYVSSEPTEEEDICRDYEGQRAGRWEFCDGEACPNPAAPNFDRPARTDVEGCCWWGRGVIQTSGVCNFGKLNYYLGAGANQRGADALFPDTDFCRNPQAICDDENPTIKWIFGMFFWMQEVQQYNEGGWSYREQVKAWVDGGMECPDEFIFGASGIVNRGCHNPPECGTGELDGAYQRATNFVTVLEAMGFDIDRSCNRPPAGGGSSTSRCGASWTAANGICGTTCAVDEDCAADCAASEACYGDLSTAPCGGGGTPAPAPPPTGGSSTSRCGASWTAANGICGTTCAVDEDCAAGEACFGDLSTAPCGGGGTPAPAPPPGGGSSTSRCGASWTAANGICGTTCAVDEDCAASEACYGDLSTAACGGGGTPAPAPPPGGGSSTSRCGASWTAANGICGTTCAVDEDCAASEACYGDLSTAPCGGGGTPAPAPPPTGGSSTSRCGASWTAANGICGTTCAVDEDCAASEACYGDLSTAACGGGGTPAPAPPPGGGSSTSRCGASWTAANGICGTTCAVDEDCAASEACYGDLSTAPCGGGGTPAPAPPPTGGSSTSRCGASWTAANGICGTTCAVDEDCAAGEACFGDLSTAACGGGGTPAPAPPPGGGSSTSRCGASWTAANGICGTTCAVDEDCAASEACYGDLSTAACGGGGTPAPAPPPGGGSSTSRCGASWTAANSICGTTCAPHPISNTQPHPISDAQPHPISDAQPHPISDAQPHPLSDARPHPISNAQPHPISDAQPHPISNAQPHPLSNAQPHPISDAQPHPISNAQPHPISNAQPHPISNAQPHPLSNAQPHPISNTQPHPLTHAYPFSGTYTLTASSQ
eukprot:jgi/Tetstr1/448253/TSEL_035541.t1